MTNWNKFDIFEYLTEYDIETIGQCVYDALIDAGYSPTDINWDLEVEFCNDTSDID